MANNPFSKTERIENHLIRPLCCSSRLRSWLPPLPCLKLRRWVLLYLDCLEFLCLNLLGSLRDLPSLFYMRHRWNFCGLLLCFRSRFLRNSEQLCFYDTLIIFYRSDLDLMRRALDAALPNLLVQK